MTLTEFLTARLDEDEAVVNEPGWGAHGNAAHAPLAWRDDLGIAGESTDTLVADPARVLAEVEAKRRIVETRAAIGFPEGADIPPGGGWTWLDGAHTAVGAERDRILRSLALPYADHPDYDEAWRV